MASVDVAGKFTPTNWGIAVHAVFGINITVLDLQLSNSCYHEHITIWEVHQKHEFCGFRKNIVLHLKAHKVIHI